MNENGLPTTEAVVTAASAALGVALTEPADLGGAARSVVLRCRTPDGSSVVVKAYGAADRSFTAEAAGLEFCDSGPGLLAVDVKTPLVVVNDLGDGTCLADLLLGGSPTAARDGLHTWARAYGRLAAATVGRRGEWAALCERYGSLPEDGGWITRQLAALPEALAGFGVVSPPALADDLAEVRGLADDRFPVFSPGDICPDNHLFTADGLRMLDFEDAGYHSVFLDAAYATMPFATCWCVFRLPDTVAAATLEAYRTEVVAAYPELAADDVWTDGLLRAVAAWTLDITVWLSPRASTVGGAMHATRPAPGTRQLLRYRWETLADRLTRAARLPALTNLMRLLLAATEEWAAAPLAEYPAFRR